MPKEKFEAVQRMQDYIEANLSNRVNLQDLSDAAGYSECHASRIFKEVVGIAPLEYLRARRLSRAAERLRDTPRKILDISLEVSFESHEGFLRAFKRRFGCSPSFYRRNTPPIPLFLPRSAMDYYLHYLKGEKTLQNNANINTVFVQVVERPARKLILQRGKDATHYFEYCEEVGCDVWGILSSIKEAIYEPLGMWLPANMIREGSSEYAQGVEVPASYDGPVPDNMEIIDLEPCRMMVFQTAPYSDEDMGAVIASLQECMNTYDPKVYGYEWADQIAPRYQLIPLPERGYIEARPVVKI
ncbi:MAG: helix-turn-helix transcriptional regulator [Candidatus Rifleibacteriota bacterium]